jgi:hypothetical protein
LVIDKHYGNARTLLWGPISTFFGNITIFIISRNKYEKYIEKMIEGQGFNLGVGQVYHTTNPLRMLIIKN